MRAIYNMVESLEFMNDPEIFIAADNSKGLKDIKEFVENKITNWEQKLPNVPKNSFKIRDILTEMKFKSSLDFPDCLDYLLYWTKNCI